MEDGPLWQPYTDCSNKCENYNEVSVLLKNFLGRRLLIRSACPVREGCAPILERSVLCRDAGWDYDVADGCMAGRFAKTGICWLQHYAATGGIPDSLLSCRLLPFNSKRSRLPNPAVRGGMTTPVGATGSKVWVARQPPRTPKPGISPSAVLA